MILSKSYWEQPLLMLDYLSIIWCYAAVPTLFLTSNMNHSNPGSFPIPRSIQQILEAWPTDNYLWVGRRTKQYCKSRLRQSMQYTDGKFGIIGQARSSFHLSVLDSVYIKTQHPVLCREKEFVFSLGLLKYIILIDPYWPHLGPISRILSHVNASGYICLLTFRSRPVVFILK